MTARKPWAILAYTVADHKSGGSPLDAAARRELKAICDAADFGRMSVAAQVDFKQPKGVFRGSLTAVPTRGFDDVTPETHPLWKQIVGDVDMDRTNVHAQEELTDLSAARADVLQEFLRFGRTECPADHYVLSFYGHAYGPIGLFCDAVTGQREPDTLRLNQLAASIRKGGRAGVVLFRDCFMNTLEAAYQLRNATQFMVATQALAPVAGIWPWDEFMAAMTPEATAFDVGQALAQQLGRFLDDPSHRDGWATTPYSLLDLDAAEACATALTALTAALDAARADATRSRACAAALEAARAGSPESAKAPGDPALLDVPTLCEGLAALKGDPVAAPAAALGELVGTQLVRSHHSQTTLHRGTSLYYKPVRAGDLKRSYLQAEDAETAHADATHYRALALVKDTGWDRVALNPFPVGD